MKRRAVTVVAAVLLATLAACGGEPAQDTDSPTAAGTASPVAASTPTAVTVTRTEACQALTEGGEDSLVIRVSRLASTISATDVLGIDEIAEASTLSTELNKVEETAPPTVITYINRLDKGPSVINDSANAGGGDTGVPLKDMLQASLDTTLACATGDEQDSLVMMIGEDADAINKDQGTTPEPSPTPTGPDTEFGPGTYRVGTMIEPGTYVSESDTPREGCYWERTDAAGNIIDNNFISSSFRAEVTIMAGDYSFTSERCGRWVKQ